MKNPSNYPIKSFACLKKITTLIFKKSVALIAIFNGWTVPALASFSSRFASTQAITSSIQIPCKFLQSINVCFSAIFILLPQIWI